jgi:hypothetical protein
MFRYWERSVISRNSFSKDVLQIGDPNFSLDAEP